MHDDLLQPSFLRGSGSHNTKDGEKPGSKLQKPFSSTFVAKMSLQTSGKEHDETVESERKGLQRAESLQGRVKDSLLDD